MNYCLFIGFSNEIMKLSILDGFDCDVLQFDLRQNSFLTVVLKVN